MTDPHTPLANAQRGVSRLPLRTDQHVEHMDKLELDKLESDLRELDDLGKMSAEAVRAQYEATAAEFQSLGEEVKDRISNLEASLKEAHGSMKLLEEAFAAIIDKGKLAHAQVEEMNGVNRHIRELHEAVMKKVAG